MADDGQSVMSPLRPGTATQEEYADALAPDRAVHASQWESLRESVLPYPIPRPPSPFNDATRVEARRLLLVTFDTDARPVTEFAVRIRFQADPCQVPRVDPIRFRNHSRFVQQDAERNAVGGRRDVRVASGSASGPGWTQESALTTRQPTCAETAESAPSQRNPVRSARTVHPSAT